MCLQVDTCPILLGHSILQSFFSECWCLRKEEDTGGGNELAAKNTGKVQKRKDTKRGYQKEAGTTGHIGRQTQKKKADVVRHVTRMKGNRLPVVALYGQVEGTRNRGRQPKKWIDNVKEDLAAQCMNIRKAGGQQQEQKDLEKSC